MTQEMFQNFDSMFSMFWVFFIIVFALGIGFTILFFWRMIRAGRTFDQMASGAQPVQPVAREKEIIREVIKIDALTAAIFTTKIKPNARTAVQTGRHMDPCLWRTAIASIQDNGKEEPSIHSSKWLDKRMFINLRVITTPL